MGRRKFGTETRMLDVEQFWAVTWNTAIEEGNQNCTTVVCELSHGHWYSWSWGEGDCHELVTSSGTCKTDLKVWGVRWPLKGGSFLKLEEAYSWGPVRMFLFTLARLTALQVSMWLLWSSKYFGYRNDAVYGELVGGEGGGGRQEGAEALRIIKGRVGDFQVEGETRIPDRTKSCAKILWV